MLPQKEMDEINAEKKKYNFDKQEFKNTFEDKYGDKATSEIGRAHVWTPVTRYISYPVFCLKKTKKKKKTKKINIF